MELACCVLQLYYYLRYMRKNDDEVHCSLEKFGFKWIGIVYELLIPWADITPFCIIICILSMIFILLIILLVFCNNITKCSDHGTCGDDGNCLCDDGYYGPNCSSKLILSCKHLQAAPFFVSEIVIYLWVTYCQSYSNCCNSIADNDLKYVPP